jgi:hypothetical protein
MRKYSKRNNPSLMLRSFKSLASAVGQNIQQRPTGIALFFYIHNNKTKGKIVDLTCLFFPYYVAQFLLLSFFIITRLPLCFARMIASVKMCQKINLPVKNYSKPVFFCMQE